MNKPRVLYLGQQEGEWPVYAFVNEAHAAQWATELHPGCTRRVLWRVRVLELGPELVARHIPARAELVERHPTAEAEPDATT